MEVIFMESKLRIKIGEIEFEVEGSENTILRERTEFVQRIMPVAMDALGNIVNLNKETIKKVKKDDNKWTTDVQGNNQSGNNNELNSEKRNYSRKSLGSFVNEKGQLSEEDFALFAAYFDEQKNQKDYFTSKDVARYYEEARRPKSSNISMSLNRLTKKGIIIDDTDVENKSPKPYRISSDGIKYVKGYQPKEKK